MFHVGDSVIYNAHGAGRVTGVTMHTMDGAEREYLVIEIIQTGMEVMVPADGAPGMRAPASEEQLDEVFGVLGAEGAGLPARWNQRHKRLQEQLKSEDLSDIAAAVRDLLRLLEEGKASPADRGLLERGLPRLAGEIALVHDIDLPQAEEQVRAAVLATPATT